MTHDRLGRPLIGPCLIWTRKLPKDGYPRVKRQELGKSPRLVHRIAYALAHDLAMDAVPPELDHLCRVPACSSPDHLEPVTRKENLARGDGNQNAGKEVCDNGHPFDAANTIMRKRGGRSCRACKRIQDRDSWRRKNRPDLVGEPAMSYADAGRSAAHPWGFERQRPS